MEKTLREYFETHRQFDCTCREEDIEVTWSGPDQVETCTKCGKDWTFEDKSSFCDAT